MNSCQATPVGRSGAGSSRGIPAARAGHSVALPDLAPGVLHGLAGDRGLRRPLVGCGAAVADFPGDGGRVVRRRFEPGGRWDHRLPFARLRVQPPASLGRTFSLAIQSIGMASASIYILTRRRTIEWRILRSPSWARRSRCRWGCAWWLLMSPMLGQDPVLDRVRQLRALAPLPVARHRGQ